MEIDWNGMLAFSMSPWELVLRGTIIYWLIFILLRISGRRDMGSLGPSDMLLLVLIADAAQNAMAGEYKSVSDGAVLVFTLVFWSAASNRVAYLFPASRRFLEPGRVALIKDGQFQLHGMRREYVSKEELMEQLRLQGVDDISLVRRAYMEASGDVSVLKKY
nr:YetF domain-containing protein [Pusillimonas sp. T7-7]